MIKPDSPLWRAWAAGVFEARITIPTNGAVLRFESTDYELVNNFRQRVGAGVVQNRGPKSRTVGDVFIYMTTNLDDARTVALFVAPLLGNRLTKKVAEFVGRIERNPHWQKKNPEKAKQSVTISPASDVDTTTASPSTQTEGPSVIAPADSTG